MAPAHASPSVYFCSFALCITSAILSLQNPPKGQPKDAQGKGNAFEQPAVEDDAPMVSKINQAIARGERWLIKNQGPEGSWQHEERAARIGYSELALFALTANAEMTSSHDNNPADPKAKNPKKPRKPEDEPTPEEHAREVSLAISRGFNFIKDNPRNETYALSLLLLALDTYNAPRWERTALAKMTPEGRKRYRYPRALTAADRAWIDQIVKELLDHRYKGLWSYTKNPGTGDISNAQFALLGLRAAANCGVNIDPRIWDESLDYFLKFQDPDGPKVTFPVLRSSPTPGRTVEIVSIDGKQRSWGYSFAHGGTPKDGGRPLPPPKAKDKPVIGWSFGATGTHSSIGVASLQIIRDELTRSLIYKKDATVSNRLINDKQKIDSAIRDGIGWLAGNWNLEEDPGGGFPFYYLYSIERVGALLGERFIGGHDWYREGAEILLRRQLKDGAWPSDMGEVNAFGAPDVASTSFALLFLRRATTPGVITPDFGEGKK